MSEKNKFDKLPYDEGPPNYEVDEPIPEIYLTNREIIYEPRYYRYCLAIVTLPILPFWLIWLAGKWLVERLRK
jgi:hypothetical protein